MIWTAAKAALFAAWSLVLAYFLVSLASQISPGLWVEPDGFAVALLAVALLIFPGLWVAFAKLAQAEEGHDAR